MEPVGLIGLGLLGSALAERLLSSPRAVLGHDRELVREAELFAAGGEVATSVQEVVRRCSIVLLSLPDSKVVASVLDSVRAELRPGLVIIDTSTGEPQDAAALGAKLAEQGVTYLDATIAGSSVQVRHGHAIAMVGGLEAAYQKVLPLLECFAKQVFHVGPWGNGSKTKLVINLAIGLHRAVLAEALVLAKALNLDLPATLAVLRAGPAHSAAMDVKGEKMLTGDFTPQARLSQHLKDVRLMLAAADRTGVALPLSSVHRELLERAEAAGWGELDNSVVIRSFDWEQNRKPQ